MVLEKIPTLHSSNPLVGRILRMFVPLLYVLHKQGIQYQPIFLSNRRKGVADLLNNAIIPLTYGSGFGILISSLGDKSDETNYPSPILQTVSR